MRIGTTIIFLVLTLIAFGFVMSDDLHIRDHNAELVNSNQELSLQSDQIQGKLATCESAVLGQQQTIAGLENEISTLNNKIVEQAKVITAIQTVNGQLLGQNSELEARNRDLENQIVEAERMANNSEVDEQTVDIQSTTSILLVIILVAQIALNLALNSRSRSRSNKRQGKNEFVRLTPEERSMIARYRRNRRA